MKNNPTRLPKVYLAGGSHSGWQYEVIKSCSEIEFYDPRTHNLSKPEQYTLWDMHHIRLSNILFGCMNKDNPSGYGLSFEVGYAKGLGKTVILVDEKSSEDEHFQRQFAIIREAADICFDSLEDGINYLKSFKS